MRETILRAFGASETVADGAGWQAIAATLVADDKLTPAAVLVPLVDRADGMTVLLTQRTSHLPSHAGQISFPGGRRQATDASPEDTALRETEEEIGLVRRHVSLVGRLGVRETGTGYRVVPVVGLVEPGFDLVPDPSEVEEVFEVPLDFLLDPANHKFETRVTRGVERQFYAIPYGRHYIWGLTARFLVNLSELVRR